MVHGVEISLIIALEKDTGTKPYKDPVMKLTSRLKADSPVATTVTDSTVPAPIPAPPSTTTTAKPPPRPSVSADKAYSGIANKIKVANKTSGSSFFGKLAQTPTIQKTPVLPKPIPLKKWVP